VIQAPRFCPELADPRLPPDVQDRLNACLKRRADELLAGQKGLVVDISRAAQEAFGRPAAAGTPGPLSPSPGLPPGSLAAAVLAWLGDVAAADLQTYAPVVAEALQAQLGPYDQYEATVLAGLNRHLNGLMQALGLDGPGAALTAPALSHVCGRTLRDWGATSE
jgi:hypothetical protein